MYTVYNIVVVVVSLGGVTNADVHHRWCIVNVVVMMYKVGASRSSEACVVQFSGSSLTKNSVGNLAYASTSCCGLLQGESWNNSTSTFVVCISSSSGVTGSQESAEVEEVVEDLHRCIQ